MPQSTQAPKKRIGYFDIARGVALLAVIVGHSSETGTPWPLVQFCYSFDMPLFFIISGWFCKPDQRLTGEFVKKSAKGLLLPYLATCVILLLAFTVRGLLIPEHGGGVTELLGRWTIACLYGAGGTWPDIMPAGVTGVGAIWYLLALFLAKIMLTAANQTKHPVVAIVALFAFGYLTADKFWLPWSFQAACCAVLWLWFGQKARACGLLEHGRIHPVAWCLMLAFWLYAAHVGGNLWMVANIYADGLLFDMLGGICGSLCVLKACMLLEEHAPRLVKPVQAFGTITLPVFCMHLIELDALPWDLVIAGLAAHLPRGIWAAALLVRFLVIAGLTGMLHCLPRPISGIYFPGRKAAKSRR